MEERILDVNLHNWKRILKKCKKDGCSQTIFYISIPKGMEILFSHCDANILCYKVLKYAQKCDKLPNNYTYKISEKGSYADYSDNNDIRVEVLLRCETR